MGPSPFVRISSMPRLTLWFFNRAQKKWANIMVVEWFFVYQQVESTYYYHLSSICLNSSQLAPTSLFESSNSIVCYPPPSSPVLNGHAKAYDHTSPNRQQVWYDGSATVCLIPVHCASGDASIVNYSSSDKDPPSNFWNYFPADDTNDEHQLLPMILDPPHPQFLFLPHTPWILSRTTPPPYASPYNMKRTMRILKKNQF